MSKDKLEPLDGTVAIKLKLSEWCKLFILLIGPVIFTLQTDSRSRKNEANIERLINSVELMIRHDERIQSLRNDVDLTKKNIGDLQDQLNFLQRNLRNVTPSQSNRSSASSGDLSTET